MSGGIRMQGTSAHLGGGIAEVTSIIFSDYEDKLLRGVLMGGCVRVLIESPVAIKEIDDFDDGSPDNDVNIGHL